VRIEAMTGAYAVAVLAIYQSGIDEGNATFETRAPGWPTFIAAKLPGHRLVATAAR
jgi:L-amino acid N-acyltransferase YncA